MRTRRSASSSSDPVSSSPPQKAAEAHQPVLLHEVLDLLKLKAEDIVVDATLGGGGHAREIARVLGSRGIIVGIDADSAAIERARVALEGAEARVHLSRNNFRNLRDVLLEAHVPRITKALFDLGWSSYQLSVGRGFSFSSGGGSASGGLGEPLLMTYDDAPGPTTVTAGTIVNSWGEQSIADILFGWGEERYARKIAKAIVAARVHQPIRTSHELAEIIARSVPRKGKIHPATRSFQALRIAVNDELGAIRGGLRAAWESLQVGGRIAVISFHSIEDREVKVLMREWQKAGEGKAVTKKPVIPTQEEMRTNPRARSAKLRVIEKMVDVRNINI